MYKVIKWILILLLSIFLLCLAVSMISGYDKTIVAINNLVSGENKIEKLFSLISLKKFHYIQLYLSFLSLITLLLLFSYTRFYTFIFSRTYDFGQSLAKLLKELVDQKYGYILFLPFLASVYYAFKMPVGFDEALTYLVFTSHNPFVSLSYYPFPNNHVLHSVITNFTRYIPFLPALFTLRISSIIINIISLLFTFKFIASFLNKKTAIIITGITSVLFLNIFYSYMSRGYALVYLFFIIGLYCSFKIVTQSNEKKFWAWLFLVSTLGFFTMPSFLYPFATLHLFVFLKRKSLLKIQAITIIATVIAVTVLYTPIIIVNGINSLIGNQYVKPISRIEVLGNLPGFFIQSVNEIFGFSFLLVLPFLIISFFYCLLYKKTEDTFNFALFILVVPVLLLLHSVIPFPRTFMYYGFMMTFLIFKPFQEIISAFKSKYLLIGIITFQLIMLFNFNRKIIPYEERDPQINITANKINEKIAGNKKYLCSGSLYGTNLWFDLKTKPYRESSITFVDKILSADTVNQFDYIIIAKYFDQTKKKKPIIENFYFSIYENQ